MLSESDPVVPPFQAGVNSGDAPALRSRRGDLARLMRDDVAQALAIVRSADLAERTIDITTTGRRSGEPRRIETVFYRYDGAIYLSGLPGPHPRAWLLNLEAEPHFTFHLQDVE